MKKLFLALFLSLLGSPALAQYGPWGGATPPVFVSRQSAVGPSGTFNGQLLAPATPTDCSAPQYSFQGDANSGYSYSGADALQICAGGVSQFSVSSAGSAAVINSGNFRWAGRTLLTSSGDGLFNVISSGGTVGVQINEGTAAPTISSGGGTSPAIVAGARNTTGSVNIGTGGTASQIVIAFASPAWTNAPYCTAWVETATAGNVRAHGVTTTTTTMTIQAASAWAASSIVAWQCIGRI